MSSNAFTAPTASNASTAPTTSITVSPPPTVVNVVVMANANEQASSQSGSDITTSTVTAATGGDDRNAPAAIRNEVVVNHALETLIETVTRSFITVGADQGMGFGNQITASVDSAAICINRFPAANRQALLSHHVQVIQDTVALWYTIMEGANDIFVPIDNEIIEAAILETMNLFDNAN